MQRLDTDTIMAVLSSVEFIVYSLIKKVRVGARDRPQLIYLSKMLPPLKSTAQGVTVGIRWGHFWY